MTGQKKKKIKEEDEEKKEQSWVVGMIFCQTLFDLYLFYAFPKNYRHFKKIRILNRKYEKKLSHVVLPFLLFYY